MNCKIFVMTHRQFNTPDDVTYIPLQVGAALHDGLGYLGDDTGDNISSKNPYYSELTGLYWAAKNVWDADYMGLCHYRRFFLGEKGGLLTGEECVRILTSYDVILPKAVRYEQPYFEVYKDAHNSNDLLLTGEVIKELYPQMYPVFEEVIHGNVVYCGNLFVTSATLFREYSNWLFSVFDKVEPQLQVEEYDAYHKRVFGFLSEQLLYVWSRSRHLKIFEVNVGLTQEKAETVELKKRLHDMVAEGTKESMANALMIFRQSMKERPDLILQGSDLSGELSDMFRVIYICDGELKQDKDVKKCMLHISKDINILMQHLKVITMIAGHIAEHKASEEEISYLRDAKVSAFMMQTILGMHPEFAPAADKLMAETK